MSEVQETICQAAARRAETRALEAENTARALRTIGRWFEGRALPATTELYVLTSYGVTLKSTAGEPLAALLRALGGRWDKEWNDWSGVWTFRRPADERPEGEPVLFIICDPPASCAVRVEEVEEMVKRRKYMPTGDCGPLLAPQVSA